MNVNGQALFEKPYQRIAVIGICGAGKSTLSRWLAEQLKLPVVHLDKLFWQSGWVNTEEKEWLKLHKEAVLAEQWVMDGNYAGTLDERLARADFVIVMRFGKVAAIRSILGRICKTFGKVRPDMAEGCPERLDMEFLKYAWNFWNTQGTRIQKALQAYPDLPVLELSSRAEVRKLMNEKV